jgi:hypothetical protein
MRQPTEHLGLLCFITQRSSIYNNLGNKNQNNTLGSNQHGVVSFIGWSYRTSISTERVLSLSTGIHHLLDHPPAAARHLVWSFVGVGRIPWLVYTMVTT